MYPRPCCSTLLSLVWNLSLKYCLVVNFPVRLERKINSKLVMLQPCHHPPGVRVQRTPCWARYLCWGVIKMQTVWPQHKHHFHQSYCQEWGAGNSVMRYGSPSVNTDYSFNFCDALLLMLVHTFHLFIHLIHVSFKIFLEISPAMQKLKNMTHS